VRYNEPCWLQYGDDLRKCVPLRRMRYFVFRYLNVELWVLDELTENLQGQDRYPTFWCISRRSRWFFSIRVSIGFRNALGWTLTRPSDAAAVASGDVEFPSTGSWYKRESSHNQTLTCSLLHLGQRKPVLHTLPNPTWLLLITWPRLVNIFTGRGKTNTPFASL